MAEALLENYEGTYEKENISILVNELFKLTDQQITAYWDAKTERGVSVSARAFLLPFLDSRISVLSLLRGQ